MSQLNFLQSLGWAVLNSLWQMALLWVLFQVITAVFKISKPSQKTSLASIFLIGGFAWFIFTFISIAINNSSNDGVFSSALMPQYGNERLNDWLHTTLPIASGIYLFLLVLPAIRFIRNYNYVKHISKQGLSKIDVQWRVFVKKISARMGIKKTIQIWVSELVSSPVTVGFFKPIILVPLAAINNLTPQQLEAVLLHELSHIRRYDYLFNLVINFIQTILYFNPFVKAFVQIIEREREKSCDEMVIQFQYDPHGYASALLLLEKANHLSRPLAIAASGKKNDLLQRVELIIGVKKKPVVSFNKLAGLFAGVLCVIALNALLILNKPGNSTTDKSFSFASLSSPFYFFTGENIAQHTVVKMQTPATSKENSTANVVEQTIKPVKMNPAAETQDGHTYAVADANDPSSYFLNAKYSPAEEIPRLKTYEEEQVKEAMDASKKVVKEEQWKAIEKNIADALTRTEKDNLKTVYLKQLNALVDWNKLENKLRISYNDLNWAQINERLGNAVAEIKLDSVQRVYSEAADYFATLEKKLSENKQRGVPDTDITIDSVEMKKAQAEKVLNTIRVVRGKKIIHL